MMPATESGAARGVVTEQESGQPVASGASVPVATPAPVAPLDRSTAAGPPRRSRPAPWRRWMVIAGGLAAGCLAAGWHLLFAPSANGAEAARLGVRVAAGCWVFGVLASAAGASLRQTETAGRAFAARRVAARPFVSRENGAGWGVWRWPSAPYVVVAAGVLLLLLALQRQPSRLVVNVVGYLTLTLPLVWLIARGAGLNWAVRVALALTAFALVPTNANWRYPPDMRAVGTESDFNWVAGWPSSGWAIRHEFHPQPVYEEDRVLVIPMANPYDGPARVFVTLNGRDLGPARIEAHLFLKVDVSRAVMAGNQTLVLELRQRPADPNLRVIAHRWVGGTSASGASSYFDGQRWWPGTFNVELGRPQPGNYMMRLDPQP